ncbi:hypothetical protein [Algibacter sp. R77976]|uniref:hypothetical protein n=1 Tax=Algibacter sp. R77976 TaxID=3093873 RepID=UPI0037C7735E
MGNLKLLFTTLFLFTFSVLCAQNNEDQWTKNKKTLKENKAPNWNYCSISGKMPYQTFIDSVNQFSILIPKTFDSKIYKKNEFIVYEFSDNTEQNDSPIIEIKIGSIVSEKSDDYFDKSLKKYSNNKSFREFGTIKINNNLTNWIDLRINRKTRKLEFYLVNDLSKRLFILTIKSFKRKFDRDYCIYKDYLKNIEWIK